MHFDDSMKHTQPQDHKSSTLRPLAQAIALACLASSPFGALAQTAPDAGQVLQQQQQQVPQLPREVPALTMQPAPLAQALPGGQQVTLQGVAITGNTVFSAEALAAVLGEVVGQSFDLGGLRGLANRISEHYRTNGYPFARAFLPPQALEGGQLRIEVVEGRYGRVQAISEDLALAAQAQAWLAPLASGNVIESSVLERTTLLLDDLPGISTAPVIRPGTEVGTGDLDVRISRDRPFNTTVGVDNHGNRYTGYHRVRANASINSPFMLGDQINLSALGTTESLWLGSVAYSAPLGATGLRGNVGYSHTRYEIGKELVNSNAEGTAAVTSAGLAYPLLRSQRTNVYLSASWQHKRLKDSNLGGAERKSSNSLPLVAQFDHRDSLGGGGITFGSVGWTVGRLKRESANDSLNTRGSFNKFNLDVARLQALPQGFTLYGRFSSQSASKNLDSSEGMGLGGASGVRAYPVGELSGDEGWLTQLELRYGMGEWAPYAFYDHGRIRVNQDGSGPSRTLAGFGAGIRYQQGPWNADVALAWRSQGGRPVDANERDAKPRLWLSVGYRF